MAFTERFSERVEDYAKYRPSYPAVLIDLLSQHGLGAGAPVMDAGSGTGILTRLLLDYGAEVFAVEPNEPMRKEAERQLAHYSGFHSVSGTAEKTGLPRGSIDLITCAQAFHWFDAERTRKEWQRILRPGSWIALVWNEPAVTSPFSQGYRELAHAFVDQQGSARSRLVDPAGIMERFFGRAPQKHRLPNYQDLDMAGLRGRALSSSYWPQSGPAHDASMDRLEELFRQHESDGLVRIEYVTEAFLGQIH